MQCYICKDACLSLDLTVRVKLWLEFKLSSLHLFLATTSAFSQVHWLKLRNDRLSGILRIFFSCTLFGTREAMNTAKRVT